MKGHFGDYAQRGYEILAQIHLWKQNIFLGTRSQVGYALKARRCTGV